MRSDYEAFREQVIIAERFGGARPWLDSYGAQEISEFFAVACEGYFVDRARFAQEHPRLLGMFDEFFLRRIA
jgi:MtfA peptidase